MAKDKIGEDLDTHGPEGIKGRFALVSIIALVSYAKIVIDIQGLVIVRVNATVGKELWKKAREDKQQRYK
jgi:hypothetical protein